jgi:hypothetical protein
MIDYHDAIREMHKGNVVQYIGTVNGNVWKKGCSFCMCRAVIFQYHKGEVQWDRLGTMLYDPDFRYELTGETVDVRAWKSRVYPEIKVIE